MEDAHPARIPYVGYLVLDDEPYLTAQECTSCGARYLDRRNACASCGHLEFSSRRLANDGHVRAFTIVHRSTPDVAVPFVSAVVDLDGGGTVKANLVGVKPVPDDISLGMKVTLTTFAVGSDRNGTEAIAFGYRKA